jgi:hypothetical protein
LQLRLPRRFYLYIHDFPICLAKVRISERKAKEKYDFLCFSEREYLRRSQSACA